MRESVWTRFWFGSVSLRRLALFRVLILLLALWDLWGYANLVLPDAMTVSEGRLPRPWNPIFLFELLGLQPIGHDAAFAIYVVLWTSLCMGLIGLFPRVTCAIAGIGMLYWTGLAYSFGKPHHDKVALSFALLALPWGPIGARYSLSALWRAPSSSEPLDWSVFPLRVTQVTIAIGYCASGLSKLTIGGLEWMNGYTLQGIMMGHDHDWSLFFAENRSLCQLSSVVTVIGQATFPIVFFWRRAVWFYLPILTSFHLIAWKTMNTGPYMALWFTMIAFIELEKVWPWWYGRWTEAGVLLRCLLLGLSLTLAGFLIWLFAARLGPWVALPIIPLVLVRWPALRCSIRTLLRKA